VNDQRAPHDIKRRPPYPLFFTDRDKPSSSRSSRPSANRQAQGKPKRARRICRKTQPPSVQRVAAPSNTCRCPLMLSTSSSSCRSGSFETERGSASDLRSRCSRNRTTLSRRATCRAPQNISSAPERRSCCHHHSRQSGQPIQARLHKLLPSSRFPNHHHLCLRRTSSACTQHRHRCCCCCCCSSWFHPHRHSIHPMTTMTRMTTLTTRSVSRSPHHHSAFSNHRSPRRQSSRSRQERPGIRQRTSEPQRLDVS
jgi:hypothetical protein